MLLIHETGTSSEVWRPLAEALGDRARTIAYDRRGWGGSPAPDAYARTTVHEQAADAETVLARAKAGHAVACGAGLGAVTSLALALQRTDLVRAVIAIEPPLFAFVDRATEQLSKDGKALRAAVEAGGPAAGTELYLSGRLPALGPGADRLPRPLTQPARDRPLSVFAELAAVPSWPLPLTEMAGNRVPVMVVVSETTPSMLHDAATELVSRLTGAELRELPGRQPPHLGDAEALAGMIVEVS